MYDPNLKPDQKVPAYQNIDIYLFKLQNRTRVDSVKMGK